MSERFMAGPGHGGKAAGRIDYRVVDATRPEQLRTLGDRGYDAILCSMALMDIPDIDPLIAAIPALLAEGGAFVFAIQHPCFNNNSMSVLIQQEDRSGELIALFAAAFRVSARSGREGNRDTRAAGAALLLSPNALECPRPLLPARTGPRRTRRARAGGTLGSGAWDELGELRAASLRCSWRACASAGDEAAADLVDVGA